MLFPRVEECLDTLTDGDLVRLIVALLSLCGSLYATSGPGGRVMLDAHNAYPHQGRWKDRIDRALAAGLPVAIEQDLIWRADAAAGRPASVVAHEKPLTGDEPTLREHFFERVRPLVERAFQENRRDTWPVIVLQLDFKTNEPEHHTAVWNLLGEYESWITTAERTRESATPQPLEWKPLLVLTSGTNGQQEAFHDRVPAGGRLRLFGGAIVAPGSDSRTVPERMVAAPASNFRRWWNNAWSVVEDGGQRRAGAWTDADRRRLESLVRHAHTLGYWIRFYTLNGFPNGEEGDRQGTSAGYNFGAAEAVRARWRDCAAAGVDFIATDQYEELAAELRPASMEARLERWKLIQVIRLADSVHHVQGIDIEDGTLWVSSVDAAARKGFLSCFELPSGRLRKQVEVQEGSRIHPGGIALQGDAIWVPVAEYDRDGPTSIQRRDKETLALAGSFPVMDHIGCIAAGEGFLIGGNWDSRVLYRWTVSGELVGRCSNPGAAYQDLKLLNGELIGSGNLSRRRGAVEWRSPDDCRLLRRLETGVTSRGVPYTNEGMTFHNGRLYLLPEDNPSRLFVFSPQ